MSRVKIEVLSLDIFVPDLQVQSCGVGTTGPCHGPWGSEETGRHTKSASTRVAIPCLPTPTPGALGKGCLDSRDEQDWNSSAQ